MLASTIKSGLLGYWAFVHFLLLAEVGEDRRVVQVGQAEVLLVRLLLDDFQRSLEVIPRLIVVLQTPEVAAVVVVGEHLQVRKHAELGRLRDRIAFRQNQQRSLQVVVIQRVHGLGFGGISRELAMQ